MSIYLFPLTFRLLPAFASNKYFSFKIGNGFAAH